MLFLTWYRCVHDSSCPSWEVKCLINLTPKKKKILNLELNFFWSLFNFILSPGTIFKAELLDHITTETKMDFVLVVLTYDFVYHMPELHFRNCRIKISFLIFEFHLTLMACWLWHNFLVFSMIDYCLLISIIFLQDADHSSHVADYFAHLGQNIVFDLFLSPSSLSCESFVYL